MTSKYGKIAANKGLALMRAKISKIDDPKEQEKLLEFLKKLGVEDNQ